jgi:maltose alpha-D-glucosyltransferase/alpha-amylase
VEVGRYLTEGARFPNTPPLCGYLEYVPGDQEARVLGVLHGFVRSDGDAWHHALDALGRYFERVAAAAPEARREVPPAPPVLAAAGGGEEIPAEDRERIGIYLEHARLLGQRTAELHLALAGAAADPALAPEPFTPTYQRSLFQSLRNRVSETLDLLRSAARSHPEMRADLEALMEREGEILERFRRVNAGRLDAVRTRIHGDYHLGQVLFTGRDFFIIDLEGEPAHSLSARRIKRSPLRDVAGMLRSFEYAAFTALETQIDRGVFRRKHAPEIEPWARLWVSRVSAAFLSAYHEAAAPGGFLPADPARISLLLDAFLLEKALYEIGYELNHRPSWAWLPLRGILRLLQGAG